jgi:ribonuclease P protein component
VAADNLKTTANLSSKTKPAGFPKSARLLRHADFERVYKQGKRHFAGHITVFYLRRTPPNGPRIGFTVSRALGGAVDRNRMKRRLREAVRKHYPGNDLPVDVVINPKKSLLKADFSELLSQIERAFEVIRNSSKAMVVISNP